MTHPTEAGRPLVDQETAAPDVAAFVQALEGRLVPRTVEEADRVIDGVRRLDTELQRGLAAGEAKVLAVDEDSVDDLHAIAEKGTDYWRLTEAERADYRALIRARGIKDLSPKTESWLRNTFPDEPDKEASLWTFRKEAKARLDLDAALQARAAKASAESPQEPRQKAVGEDTPSLTFSVIPPHIQKPVVVPPKNTKETMARQPEPAKPASAVPTQPDTVSAPKLPAPKPAVLPRPAKAPAAKAGPSAAARKRSPSKRAKKAALYTISPYEHTEAGVDKVPLLGQYALLQLVEYAKGAKHWYGVDGDDKRRPISHDAILEAYGHAGDTQGKPPKNDPELPVPDTAVTDKDIAHARAIEDIFAMNVTGMAPEEVGRLTDSELFDIFLRRRPGTAPAAPATTAQARPAAAVPAPPRMISPPPRPSRWQQLRDAPHRWAIRGKEWALRHKAATAVGGLAVAAAVYGTTYFLTRDHATAHNAVGELPSSGGGTSHDTAQSTLTTGGHPAGASTEAAATNPGLTQEETNVFNGRGGAGASGAAQAGLIDNPYNGRGGGSSAATDPRLIQNPFSGHAGGSSAAAHPRALHNIGATLTHSGDTVWNEIKSNLHELGLPSDKWSVDFVKDRVLPYNGLTEATARGMDVGARFTIPREILEDLLKAKK